MTNFVPQPGSAGARAVHYLRKHCGGSEATSLELATAMQVNVNTLSAFLASVMRHKLVVRERRDGKTYWRLGPSAVDLQPDPPAQPPAEVDDADLDVDDAPITRVLTSASSQQIDGLPRQSWCPVALPAGIEGSLDELPEPPPPSPAAPPLGLGWRAPRVPVYLGEPPAPVPSPQPAAREPGTARVDRELDFLEERHADAVAKVIAPSVNDETVLALSAALAPHDPDFDEVARAPAPPEPNTPPKGAEAAQAPMSPCGRDDATPNDGVVPQRYAEEFRCALWSNEMLELITSEGKTVLLGAADARGLLRYVSDVLSARVRATA